MIVYVTEASTAFRDASEVKTFLKIKELVDTYNLAGKYIDLVVLVNKFDDPDEDDLNAIYSNILGKIGDVRLYRYSAHRTLMNFPGEIVVPDNDKIQKEYKKIARMGKQINGDIDKFVDMLLGCRQLLYDKTGDSIVAYNRRVLEKIHLLYSDISLRYDANMSIINETIYYSKYPSNDEFIQLYSKFNFEAGHMDKIKKLFIEYLKLPVKIGNEILTLRLYEMFVEDFYDTPNIISVMFLNIDANINNISINCIAEIFYKLCEYNLDFGFRQIFNFLMIKNVKIADDYSGLISRDKNHEIQFYNNRKKTKSAIDLPYNWYFANLLGTEIPRDMKYIIFLSNMTSSDIKYLNITGQIDYKIFEKNYPHIQNNIAYCIAHNKNIDNQILMLPIKETEELAKYVKQINTICNM